LGNILHLASHLSGTIGLGLHLLHTLRHLLYLLLEFLIFRGNAPDVPETLRQETAHFFPSPGGEQQAHSHSHQYPIGKTTHLFTPFVWSLGIVTSSWIDMNNTDNTYHDKKKIQALGLYMVPFQERERSRYSGEEEFFLSCFHAAHTPLQAKKAAFLCTRVSQVFVMIGRQFSPTETVH